MKLLRDAAAACRATPGRDGHLVRLAGVDDVLVAGDIHGQIDHFQQLLKIADLGNHPRRHMVLQEVIHGPFEYPNGADKSHQLLDLTAALKCQYPARVHFLPGNHEYAQATARPIARSKGELNSLFRAGVDVAYGDVADNVYRAYLDFIRAAPLAVRTPNRVFLSHSLPPAEKLPTWKLDILTQESIHDDDLQPTGSAYWLVWGRDLSEQAAADFLAKVDADLLVTGHIPCDGGFQSPNGRQLVLDCQEPPGGYCVFPADRPLTHHELVACARTL